MLSTNSKVLTNLLNKISRVPNERGIIPTTRLVKLDFHKNNLIASCDNLEMKVSYTIEIECDYEKSILVDFFAFRKFISTLPDQPIEIVLNKKNISIKAVGSTFELAHESPDVFPERNNEKGDFFEVKTKEFIRATKNCLSFISIKDMDQFKYVQYRSNDGYFAYAGSHSRVHSQNIQDKGVDFSLKSNTAKELCDSLEPDVESNCTISSSNIIFDQGNLVFDVTLPNQHLPELKKLYEINTVDFELSIDFSLFRSKMNSVLAFCDTGYENCHIAYQDKSMVLTIKNIAGQMGIFKIPCQSEKSFSNNILPKGFVSASKIYENPKISITKRGFYFISDETKKSIISINK